MVHNFIHLGLTAREKGEGASHTESPADGEGDDAEEITFHDVLPDPADAGVPLPGSSGRPAGQVRRARPWYVRAVLGAMDGVVQGDAP